jgi:hypothetical protein
MELTFKDIAIGVIIVILVILVYLWWSGKEGFTSDVAPFLPEPGVYISTRGDTTDKPTKVQVTIYPTEKNTFWYHYADGANGPLSMVVWRGSDVGWIDQYGVSVNVRPKLITFSDERVWVYKEK